MLSPILEELNEETKFFDLNIREREIFISLTKNTNLSESDSKSISELKDIVINRYQELIKRDEQSDRLSIKNIYTFRLYKFINYCNKSLLFIFPF